MILTYRLLVLPELAIAILAVATVEVGGLIPLDHYNYKRNNTFSSNSNIDTPVSEAGTAFFTHHEM